METSPSKLLHFLDCVRYWKEGAYGPAMAGAMAGKEFHNAVHRHALAVLADPATEKTPLSFVDTQDPDMLAEALDLLANYQSHKFFLPDPETLLSSEAHDSEEMHKTLNKPIYKAALGDGHFVEGIPDRVSMKKDYLIIDDWKTGFVVGDDPFQLSCYAVMVSDRFGVKKVKGRYNYIRLGFTVPYWYDECDIEHHRYRMLALVKKMEAYEKDQFFPETISKSCSYCTLKNNCRAYARVLNGEEAPPPVPEEQETITSALEKEKEMKARKKIFEKVSERLAEVALNKVKPEGTIEDNVRYGIKEIPCRYHYELVPMIVLLQKFGLEWGLELIMEVVPAKVGLFLERKNVKEQLRSAYQDFFSEVMLLKQIKASRKQITQGPASNPEALAKAAEDANGKVPE